MSLFGASQKGNLCPRTNTPVRTQSTATAERHDFRSAFESEEPARTKGLNFSLNWSQRPPEDPRSRTAAVLRVGNHDQLHEELLRRANAGDLAWTRHLVHFLVHERGEQPDIRHYYALIVANTDPALGSVEEVERLVQEMENSQMTMDAGVYHAVLKVCVNPVICYTHSNMPQVLSIHPSYLLRLTTLSKMKQNWLSLTASGHAYIIAGLIREKQIESALEAFTTMQSEGHDPPLWLINLLLYATLSINAFPEAESLLSLRLSLATQRDPVSATTWSYILTVSARALYHPLVTLAWDRAVTTSHLNPSSGQCTTVLESCARAGDPDLATDVFRVLGERSSPIAPHHYETLLECYVGAGDIPSALSVLNIMAKSTQPPTDASARPLYLYLRDLPQGPKKAADILKQRAKKLDLAPICAVNAILEAYIHKGVLDEALELYKIHGSLVAPGVKANTHTFNALLRGCARDTEQQANSDQTNPSPAKSKLSPMFLAAEMRAMSVKPDSLTYDRLILACVREGTPTNVDFAWRYFLEMRAVANRASTGGTGGKVAEGKRGSGRGGGGGAETWWPRRGTFVALARKLAEMGDGRVWSLLDEGAGVGMDVVGLRRRCEEEWDGGRGSGKE